MKENKSKRFAEIDEDLFKAQTIVDTHSVVKKINKNKKYQSFQEIIEQAISENFPAKKRIYKIKKTKAIAGQGGSNDNEPKTKSLNISG